MEAQGEENKRLSIVATMYKSSPYLREFCARSAAAAEKITADFEIVLVNDGSPDDSLEVAIELHQADPRIKIVDLSRNFGHHKAMMTGLEYARGELIFLIDCDLEEDPEWLESFAEIMQKDNADVVYGRQRQRKGGWLEKYSGEIYYTLFNWLCSIDHPRNIVTARLMTRRYVDALVQHKERELVISCLWVITGFKQSWEFVEKKAASPSTYSFWMRVQLSITSITSFSKHPLECIFWIGAGIFTLAVLWTMWLIVKKIFYQQALEGWTAIMVSIWLLGGLIILFIGILGIYIAKIFSETKQRPYVVVRKTYSRVTKHHYSSE